MQDDVLLRAAERRLIEWAQSRHREPWNYWPPVSVLGRIREEGAGASQSTAGDRDGGLAHMIDLMADGIAKDRRCAEVRDAYYRMPHAHLALVDALYRSCASARDVPRHWEAAAGILELPQTTFFRRKKEMLVWLVGELCLSDSRSSDDVEMAAKSAR